jgi:outer membrane immunogenic protein
MEAIMRSLLLASAAILSLSGAAYAADAVDQIPAAPAAVEEVQVFTWSGPYVGMHGGYGWSDSSFDVGGGPSLDADLNGGLLGAFVGYNYQFSNNWVVGIEADVEHNWNEEDIGGGADARTEWQGSVRARVGYAFDQTLVYATGGWAGARGEISVPGFGSEKEMLNGYTVGAGIEHAFTDMIFARVEYRYTDFSDKTFDFSGAGGGTIDADIKQHAIRVGLGVKF